MKFGVTGGLLNSQPSLPPFYHEGFEMATSFAGMGHFALLFPLRAPVDFTIIWQFLADP